MAKPNIQDLIKEAQNKTGTAKPDKVDVGKHSILLNDKVYTIKPLPWAEGMDLWESMMKTLLPSVGTGIDGIFNSNEFSDKSTFAEMMLHLGHNLSGSTMRIYSVELFQEAKVDGQPLDPNVEFSANYGAWLQLFVFAVKENFQSFFTEGWSQGINTLMEMLKSLQDKDSSEEQQSE